MRTEHVRGEHQLVALGGLRALGRHHARVVDEHVQRALERGRIGATVRERADVEHVDGEVGARHLAPELALDPLAVLAAANRHVHTRAEAGEPGRGRAPEAGLRAGHDRDLAVEPRQVVRTAVPAGEVAEVSITDERAVQRGVEQGRDAWDAWHVHLVHGRPHPQLTGFVGGYADFSQSAAGPVETSEVARPRSC